MSNIEFYHEVLKSDHRQGLHQGFPHPMCLKCNPVANPSQSGRRVSREERIRYWTRNGVHYKVLIAWYKIASGDLYHYIHVYEGASDIPFRWLRWWTDSEGNFLDWG